MHEETMVDGTIRRKFYKALPVPQADLEASQERLRKRLARDYRVAVRDPQTERILQVLKIGRNDPCPCGSGRKFKVCCAHLAEPV